MDVTPFSFIKIDEHTDAFVLNKGRRKFNRIYFLFFPLLILAFSIFFLFVLNKKDMPGWYNWAPLLFSVTAFLILFSVHTVELRFNKEKIWLAKRNVFKKWDTVLLVADQKKLAKRNVRAKKGGNYIYAIDNKNNKVILLVIPYWDMKEAKGDFIAQAISDKTGLPIEKI